MVPIRLVVVVALLSLPVTAGAAVSFYPAAVVSSFDANTGDVPVVVDLSSEAERTPIETLDDAESYVTVPSTASVGTSTLVPEPTWTDTDADGLTDRLEVSLGTDSTAADTDSDGLDDWTEVLRHDTDPLDADSDGDSFFDGTEHRLGLDPTVPERPSTLDTDGDGLPDDIERRIGTNRTVADTDGDGLSDGAEVYGAPRQFPDADPLHKDLYFEVDAYHTVTVNQTALDRTAAFFASAPVDNPDGTTGFAVHFVVDETDLTTPPAANVRDNGAVTAHFDGAARGYLYIYLAETVSIGDRGVRASANYGRIAMAGDDQTDRLYVHEIGHLLGVHGSDGPGVDSYEASVDEYPSIMSYEYLNSNRKLRMAAGDESPKSNDDWDDISRRFARWIDTAGLDSEPVANRQTASDTAPPSQATDRHTREQHARFR
ncbi:hypothetical protein GJR96_06120 [Haloferax sp. MBLA0076]|uniref:Matrixin n=1 Tax=Haloferax litoreum TaxID=2666140 RepID=A0A6A8GFG9_9EURY|nr:MULTISPECIES: hypothetical protein [Haloferax]KAB1193040.1 hypothetical protein Hfx1148_06115 [Haloferax sp. CBA1148]MRX21531.1 hypothetical protein [Haloferax litoreum]